MINKKQLGLIILVLSGILAWSYFKPEKQSQIVYSAYINEESSDSSSYAKQESFNSSVDFVESESEAAEMTKWQNLSFESLLGDANNGDRAALYMLGLSHLFGFGVPVSIEAANLYFAKSASLGFAPALNKLKFMYIEDIPNPYLAMVYLNLTIAFGHIELTQSYYELMNKLTEKVGSSAIQREIEKLASKKFNDILDNQVELKSAADKASFVFRIKSITDKDRYYDSRYWQKFYQSTKSSQNEPWYLHIDSIKVNDETKEFLRLTAKGFLELSETLLSYISRVDIQKYLTNNVPELMETKEGQYEICRVLGELNSIPRIKANAMREIIKENNGKCLYDLKRQTNKRIKSQVNKIIHDFKLSVK